MMLHEAMLQLYETAGATPKHSSARSRRIALRRHWPTRHRPPPGEARRGPTPAHWPSPPGSLFVSVLDTRSTHCQCSSQTRRSRSRSAGPLTPRHQIWTAVRKGRASLSLSLSVGPWSFSPLGRLDSAFNVITNASSALSTLAEVDSDLSSRRDHDGLHRRLARLRSPARHSGGQAVARSGLDVRNAGGNVVCGCHSAG
jgi:hypothetical protein